MKLLEVENITKKFPGVLALKNVNMSFERGKVHCILGENGAGKSTLVKIISGVFTPENGNIYINEDNMLDKRYLFDKVSYVPQEISLFNHMTVAENILLPFDKIENDSFFINQKKINTQVLPLLDTMNINLAPEKEVNEISVTERQLIQVARALSREDYEVIIFDEPTTSLDEKGKKSLFKIIERLKDKGNAIIYITHKVEELFLIGDEVTVLREGKEVGHSDISAIDQDWMIKKMSGKSIDDKVNYRPRGPFPKKIL
ncbi:MAG: ATP-binding cassette domain-containing protein, partial [bacterium]